MVSGKVWPGATGVSSRQNIIHCMFVGRVAHLMSKASSYIISGSAAESI